MNTLNRIQALIELKEKGAISEIEYEQMVAIINKDSKTNQKSSKVKESISELREKGIIEQAYIAYENKDWKTLRAKYEQITNRSLISLEVSTALFAYERRKSWIEKEAKAKRLDAQIATNAKKKKLLLVSGSVTVIVIFGLGLYFFKSTSTKTSVEQSEVIYNKKEQLSNDNQIEKKLALQPEASKLDEKRNIKRTKVNQQDVDKNTNQTTVKHEVIKQPEMKDEFKIQPPNGNQNKELLIEFPEVLLDEAESLKNKILDPNVKEYDKILASLRVKTICRDYNAGLNKKWKAEVQTSIRLNRCYVIAEDYF